jgi:hypothetical protein
MTTPKTFGPAPAARSGADVRAAAWAWFTQALELGPTDEMWAALRSHDAVGPVPVLPGRMDRHYRVPATHGALPAPTQGCDL